MRFSLLLSFVFCIFLNSCKTTNSDTKDTSGESAELSAAIEATILKFYGDVKSHPDVIRQFATALQTDSNAAALPVADLRRFYETRALGESGKDSKFERYVAHEFIALTNYLTWKILPGQTLMYMGSAINPK